MSVNVRRPLAKSQQERRPTRIFKRTTTATDRLRAAIKDGTFKPGQWINKAKVGKDYGVGIGSMETACQALVREGLLEPRRWQTRVTYYVAQSLLSSTDPAPAFPQTAAQRITSVLRERLAAGQYPMGSRMPTQEQIAEEFNTHQPTVWRAMANLKQEGLVRGVAGQRATVIALPKPTPEQSAVEMAQALSEEDEKATTKAPLKRTVVIDYLRSLILDGTHAGGSTMPTLRDVATKMGVSLRTVDEAYTQLAAEGLVTIKHGVGVFVIPESERPPAHGTTKTGKRMTDAVIEELATEAEEGYELPSEAPNPLANLVGFITRLADIGATAELQRLWQLEAEGLSREAEAKLQAEVAELRKELDEAQAENRNLVSGITALREEKVKGVGQFKNLQESYLRLQKAHEKILADFKHLRGVAELVGGPQHNGRGVSKLAVETALRERKPLPARPGY